MAELTPEQVMEQLRVRGYETGGFRSPLRWFRGKLTSITGSMVQRGSMPQARLEVLYNFDEIEVFESSEPYAFPVAQINIMHNNRIKSNMGVLGLSMDKIINAGVDENTPQDQVKNQDFLVGKIQEWKVTTGHMMWDNDRQQETARECFEVVYIEGVGGAPHSGVVQSTVTKAPAVAPAVAPQGGVATVTPAQQALDLLDGKTQQQWNNTVFQDPLVKSSPELINSIIQGTFIPPMEASGIITKDENGIYHKAG